MSSKSKPIIPDAAIIENNSTYQVDVIDSTSKYNFLWQWLKVLKKQMILMGRQ